MLINVKIKRFVTYAPYSKSHFETFINFDQNSFADIFDLAKIEIVIKPEPPSQITSLEKKPATKSKKPVTKGNILKPSSLQISGDQPIVKAKGETQIQFEIPKKP